MLENRPLFLNMVRSASTVDRVLKSGSNSRKLGGHFCKGEWIGLPIYSLSLPERASCPASCEMLDRCYGNHMQIAPRFTVDSALMAKLAVEIETLASIFPSGYALRCHAIGDFADLAYVRFWLDAIRSVRPLHVFGFTAHKRSSDVGGLIDEESAKWDRFRIR